MFQQKFYSVLQVHSLCYSVDEEDRETQMGDKKANSKSDKLKPEIKRSLT